MNGQSKSLLVVRIAGRLSNQDAADIKQALAPMCQEIGAEVLVVDGGADASLHQNLDPLIAMMGKQVAAISRLAASNEALVRAMADAEGDPPALVARGLDGRPL